MWWFLPATVAAVAAGVGYYAASYKGLLGDRVLIYTLAFAEADRIARELAAQGWSTHASDTAAGVIRAVQQHARISRLVFVGHGGWTWFFSPAGMVMSDLPTVGAAIGSRLVAGGIVSLAGCSTARNPEEPDVPCQQVFLSGGSRSYAARLRDSITGWHPWSEVRAHTLAGHVLYSAAARSFRIGHPGEVGESVMRLNGYNDWQQWQEYFTGYRAARWMLGD